MTGYRTYILLAVTAIYNLVIPKLGLAEQISQDEVQTVVNTLLLIGIAVFHKLHKPKEEV